ncbi:MAG: phospholipid carrier-dependent glycosyltransferase [Roseiflexaceae bacterium]|nr:phospholipid carrier-dependent glycosyltransferase [Roseiflexaceae bacterium]
MLGQAGGLAISVLALGFAAALVAQPSVRMRLRGLLRWQGLPAALALGAILLLGAALRFTGIRFGLPYLDHPDEWATAEPALRMLKTADFAPDSFTYPSLTTYMQLGIAAIHFLAGVGGGLYTTVADVAPEQFYPWGRAFTALLGTLALGLTYALGAQLYGRAAGLIAALLLAVYPLAAGDAHYITTDTPAMFWTLLAFVAIVRLVCGSSSPVLCSLFSVLAGLLVGLAVSTKYNVAVLVLPLVVGISLAVYDQKQSRSDSQHTSWPIALGLFGCIAGFTLGTPFWLPRLPQLLNDLAAIVVHYRFSGHAGAEADLPILAYWEGMLANGALLAWLFLVALALAFVRRSRADLLVLAFVVPSLLQLASVRVVFLRNLVPVLPFLCLLAGVLVVRVGTALAAWAEQRTTNKEHTNENYTPPTTNRRPRTAFVPLLITALVVAQPLAIAAHDELLRSRPTTRLLATEWVAANVPPGALLWMENNTLTLPSQYRVRGGEPVTTNPPAWYREQGFGYLVVDRDARVRQQDATQLDAFGEPLVSFAANGERHGPAYTIYTTGTDIAADARTPSGATLGQGALVLDGYRHPGIVAPGGTLSLALYWRVERELPQDYTLFVHLVDAAGSKLAQRDTPPLDGARPTSSWQPGELLRDNPDLFIPETTPPGSYTLLIGMYDPASFASINDTGPVQIGTVVVERPR